MHNILSFKAKLKKLWTSSFSVWLAGQIWGTIIVIIGVALVLSHVLADTTNGGKFPSDSSNNYVSLLFTKFLAIGIIYALTCIPLAIASVVLTILYIISLMKFSNPEPLTKYLTKTKNKTLKN